MLCESHSKLNYSFIFVTSKYPRQNSINKISVPMVLNPYGIEPTFLELNRGFYSYYNLQCIKLDKEIYCTKR